MHGVITISMYDIPKTSIAAADALYLKNTQKLPPLRIDIKSHAWI